MCIVSRVTLSTSIEYQKEMDPAAIVEKKNDEKESEKEEQSDDNVVSTPLGMDLPKTAVDPVERLARQMKCFLPGQYHR